MPTSIIVPISPSAFSNRNSKSPKSRKPNPPISISANRSLLNPTHLQSLFTTSTFSCHRFPILTSMNKPEPVNIDKLNLAIKHSYIVVSAFCKKKYMSGDGRDDCFMGFLGFAGDQDLQLVGFGRAISDGGLTASIHDVVVIPQLRRLGIGRKIVERITRFLRSREIYDISALCSEKESLFCPGGYQFRSMILYELSCAVAYTMLKKLFAKAFFSYRFSDRRILLVYPYWGQD